MSEVEPGQMVGGPGPIGAPGPGPGPIGDPGPSGPIEEVTSPDRSLSSRMAVRQQQLEEQTSEWFPIPGWEDMLEVELKALGYTQIRKAQKGNEKVRDEILQELYNIADQIKKATIGFREVPEDGGERKLLVGETWVTIARRAPGCPDGLTERQAVLWLVGEKRIHFLAKDWGEWARTVRPDVDKEVVADFAATG
jgi:hypothetical protein